jgi:polar amino acid transport system ATP-binding protein
MVSEVLAVIRRLARQGMTMAVVTHETEFARDVSTRVFYLDEGLVYDEGPPERIFDHPQRQRDRDFIGKVRSLSYHVTTADYDLYALVGKIEGFCEKHLIPHRTAHAAQLLAEEVLGVLLTPLAPPRAVPTGQIVASSALAGTASTGPPLTVKVPASPAPSGPTHPDIELVLALLEKQRSLELRLDGAGPPGNPLENANLPDDLALNLIRHYAADIGYERVGERNRLRMSAPA